MLSAQWWSEKKLCLIGWPIVFALVLLLGGIAWGRGYVEGELLIKYKPDTTAAMRQSLTRKHAFKPVRNFPRLGIHHIKLPEGMSVKEAIKKLRLEKNVAYIEPNHVRKPHATPNDPQWLSQWGLPKIKMPFAWEISHDAPNVIVAVLDTGINTGAEAHPDLAENLWVNTGESNCSDGIDNDGNGKVDDCLGWNFYDGSNYVFDDYGHGTHVAGIIGAVGNNSVGVAGVAWKVKIMPVRFIGANGGSVADEIAGIEYAIQNGARIINASFGSDPMPDPDPDQCTFPNHPEYCTFSVSEYEAIRAARDAGVLFVAAAGNGWNNNDGNVRNYPSSYSIDHVIGNDTYTALDNVIAVAASDVDDNLADYSNWGASSVHIAAPGSDILSTSVNPSYVSMWGTSMSAAFVSGAAALLMAVKPSATIDQIKTALLQSVDQIPSLDSLVSSGGRLNVYKALLALDPVSPLALSAGWNFVSLPLQPPDTTISAVLGNALSCVRVIWGFDNSTKQWKKFKPQTDTSLSTLELGKGYWMFLDAPGMIDMSGWTLPSTTLTLYPGWNLVGFSGKNGALADIVLGNITSGWEIIWSWGASIWSARAASIPDLPVPPVETFQHGKAYWINLDAGFPLEWTQ